MGGEVSSSKIEQLAKVGLPLSTVVLAVLFVSGSTFQEAYWARYGIPARTVSLDFTSVIRPSTTTVWFFTNMIPVIVFFGWRSGRYFQDIEGCSTRTTKIQSGMYILGTLVGIGAVIQLIRNPHAAEVSSVVGGILAGMLIGGSLGWACVYSRANAWIFVFLLLLSHSWIAGNQAGWDDARPATVVTQKGDTVHGRIIGTSSDGYYLHQLRKLDEGDKGNWTQRVIFIPSSTVRNVTFEDAALWSARARGKG